MHIAILSSNGVAGTAPSVGATPTFTTLLDRKALPTGSLPFYKRGHLLSEKAYGPGDTWENLTPLSESGNQKFASNVESIVKEGLEKGLIFKFTVKVIYGSRNDKQNLIDLVSQSQDSQDIKDRKISIIEAEDFVPHGLNYTLIELNNDGTEKQGGIKHINKPIPNDIKRQVSEYRVANENAPPSPQLPLF